MKGITRKSAGGPFLFLAIVIGIHYFCRNGKTQVMKRNDLAQHLGINPDSVRKNCYNLNQNPEILSELGLPDGFAYGTRDDLPQSVIDYFLKGSKPKPEEQPPVGPVDVRPPVKPKSRPARPRLNGSHVGPVATNKVKFDYVGASILVAADAAAFSWIAYEAYHNVFVVGLFFLVGMAVGYSAFRNIIGYSDKDQAFKWGFAFFQLCLHTAALQVLPDGWNEPVGKVVIAIGIPLATVGIGLVIKENQ